MIIYTVQPGDTVWSIARQHGISASRILSDNGIFSPQNLPVGQALVLLFPETVYRVRSGDTLSSIAQRFAITEISLLQNNPYLINTLHLQTGQELVIHFQEPKRRTLSLNGYAYTYVNKAILRYALPYLTYFTIFGYGFTENGALIPIDDQELIRMAYQYKTAPVMLLSSLTENGNFSSQRASLLFRDTAFQDRLFTEILGLMKEKGYLGLDVDFEYVSAEDAGNFQNFLRRAAERLHEEGFFLHVDLAPKTSTDQKGLLYEAHDYGAIGAIADTVLLMTYEWGYTYGPPMAVAPLNMVRKVAEYGTGVIAPEKIYLGLANYGYDWILPYEKGVTMATSIGNEYAVEIAARNRAAIEFDPIASSPTFQYFGRPERSHVVWFEDAKSMEGKFNLMEEFSLRGGGYWNLMRPFNQNWAFVNARYNIRKVVV